MKGRACNTKERREREIGHEDGLRRRIYFASMEVYPDNGKQKGRW